jgi:hypothetical protein
LTARDAGLPAEWAGAVAVNVDALAQLEATTGSSTDATAPIELAGRTLPEVGCCSEWSATHAVDVQPCAEYQSAAAVDAGALGLEWADPPGLLLVSSGRRRRSPGRIRILAGPNSTRPLRGQ